MEEAQYNGLYEAISSVAEVTAKMFSGLEAQFRRLEAKVDGVDGRLDGVDGRLDRVERRLTNLEDAVATGFREVDRRFGRLERRR